METKSIGLKSKGLIPLAMAALMTLITLGCEEDVLNPSDLSRDAEYAGHVKTETFKVQPGGTDVSVFGGSILLEFPEGSVSAPTLFVIGSVLTDQFELTGINMYHKGFYLEGDSPGQVFKNVTIHVKYDLDPESWKMNPPGSKAEQNLTIYRVFPDFEACQGIRSIGDCCVDCESQAIQGCINNCGYFVVGEN